MPIIGLTLGAVPSGQNGRYLLKGYIADASWAWAIGGPAGMIYASATAGEMTQVPPGGTVVAVAVAKTATSILFCFPAVGGGGGGGGTSDPEHTANYIIWTDGVGIYYAKDGHTGIVTSNPDAATLIQSCLDVGGFIVIKNGIYNITGASPNLSVGSNTTLMGEGSNTLLNLTGDAYIALIINKDRIPPGNTNIALSNFSIKCDGTDPLGPDPAISFLEVSSFLIEKINVEYSYAVIAVVNGENGIIRDNVIDATNNRVDSSIIYTLDSTFLTIESNIIINSNREGMYISDGSENFVISGNYISGTTGEGIELKPEAHNNVVKNNMLINNTNGIYIASNYNVISGNIVTDGTNGIIIDDGGSPIAIPTGNLITDNRISSASQYGVLITKSASTAGSNTVTGNGIYSCPYGVYVANVDNMTINGNIIQDCTVSIGLVNSDDNVVSNNTSISPVNWGLYGDANSDNNIFMLNNLSVGGPKVSINGVGNVIKNNVGYPNSVEIFHIPVSYVVYEDAGVYYAQNGATSTIDESNADAYTVIYYAVTHGSSVYLKDGTYNMGTQLVIPANVHLIGESWNAIIKYTADGKHLTVASTGGQVIRNLQIDGDVMKSYGIYLYRSNDVTIDNCYIHDTLYTGVNILESNKNIIINNKIEDIGDVANGVQGIRVGGLIATPAADNVIMNNKVSSVYAEGIYTNAAYSYRTIIEGNLVDSCANTAGQAAITIGGDYEIVKNNKVISSVQVGVGVFGGDYCQIIGNVVSGSGSEALHIETSTYCRISGNEVISNSNQGIRILSDSHYNVVTDNVAKSNTITGILLQGNYNIVTNNQLQSNTPNLDNSGTGNLISYNKGYVTENSGTATITAAATSIAVTHGLSYTPSALDVSVVLTNLPTTPIGDIYVDTFTSTQFTIHCTSVPGVATAIFAWAVRKTP